MGLYHFGQYPTDPRSRLGQIKMHTGDFQQTYPLTSVILNKNVNITVIGLLTSRERAKEPSLHDWLSLEVFSNCFCHQACCHHTISIYVRYNNTKKDEKDKEKNEKFGATDRCLDSLLRIKVHYMAAV